MRTNLDNIEPAEYINGEWVLEIKNRAGVSVRLCERTRSDLCERIYDLFPSAKNSQIARLAKCSTPVVFKRLKKIKGLQQRQEMLRLQRQAAVVDALVPPEHKGSNAVQIGGDHYQSKAIQPWDYIISNDLGYLEGNIVKYVSRWKEKGGVEDLKKAQHYLAKLIEVNQ